MLKTNRQMKTEPNDLVHAYGYANEQSHFDSQGGLTKREHFAAMAMQGLLSNPEWMQIYEGQKYIFASEIVAQTSLNMADALIEQLNKTEK